MNVQDLIPKHKGDDSVIEPLKKLSFEEIKPIVPELLVWLQDINWPIAGPVADVLQPFVDQIVPDIINIMKTNDGIWKLWVLILLLRDTRNPILLKEIERIATSPTSDEILEEANIEAKAIITGDWSCYE